MNIGPIDAIAKAVLYEGYMLYPYRPSSVKNRQRFNFGVLYPKSYSDAQTGSDAWQMQTEFLVQGDSTTEIEVRVRFLKLVDRSVRKLGAPTPNSDAPPNFEPVTSLEANGRIHTPWQEAMECEVKVPIGNLDLITSVPVECPFAFLSREELELLHNAQGEVIGMISRKQQAIRGTVEIRAARLTEELFKVQVRVKNLTPLELKAKIDFANVNRQEDRDLGLMRSLVSAHIVLGVFNGQFVSLLEPPDDLRETAADCENIGAWPVLVGAEGERDTMLASPIILYDYPQIAPESPGDLFDGTEIDEILALRILTMTDAEKTEMRATDERARLMLDRTEALPIEQLQKLHGTLRELHRVDEEVP
jgi:hypothetical protein